MDFFHRSDVIKASKVKIDDPFWNSIIKTVRKNMLPYQYMALNDEIDAAEKSYCVENFIKANKVKKMLDMGKEPKKYPVDKWHYDETNSDKNAFHGWVFQDSDAYKWIEAVGYSLINEPDSDLESKAKKLIGIICAAQLDNGYLDTLYIINDRSKIFTNLKDHHELYCFGHMAMAAVSFYNATGDKSLLNAAYAFADLICDTFGENGVRGYPGHEIAESGLIKLYEISHSKKYFEMAKFFIDERGKKPYYFDKEQGTVTDGSDYIYNQAHMPVRMQNEAVGHAVRGVYLFTAMAECAGMSNDFELYKACKRIWNNIVNKKMYITGGIGSIAKNESFGPDYFLPNDTAYCETCASIGLIFFAREMSRLTADSDFADIAEKALYNTVTAAMSEDGKSFFYVNPLEVIPNEVREDPNKSHIKTVRQKWFGCACCPPNLARLLSSLNEYIFTENENTLFINQYIGCLAQSDKANIKITSSYIENATVKISIKKAKKPFELALRIPNWSEKYNIDHKFRLKNGYALLKIDNDCEINITFCAQPRLVICSDKVRHNTSKAAVVRGPIVYCAEEADNGAHLNQLRITTPAKMVYKNGAVYADGVREKYDCESLYFSYQEPEKKNVKIKFIPYCKWARRGENEMSVYIRI